MTLHTIVNLSALEAGLVLAPERYDPRRQTTEKGRLISQFAVIVREQLVPGRENDSRRFVVLDTSDAAEGFIRTMHAPVTGDQIGSAKKLIRSGDIIISRLRPYLRQVAYVDVTLTMQHGANVGLACSTEFFVLRSSTKESLAFLVPFLLTDSVQASLAVAQEGGHHPRFSQTTLEAIRIPDTIAECAERVSSEVEAAIAALRHGDVLLREIVARCSTVARYPAEVR